MIINCHTHLFTSKHIPDDFVAPGVGKLMQWSAFRKGFQFLLNHCNPFSDKDVGNRFARFLQHMSYTSQFEVYKDLAKFYPADTKFVVLPMDFEDCGMNSPEKDIDEQQEELAKLRDEFPNSIIPFCSIRPAGFLRRKHYQYWIEEKGFAGFKFYPALWEKGINSAALDEIYAYACNRNLPIITHCGGTSVRRRGYSTTKANMMIDPKEFKYVLQRFPTLRLCFAHWGGVGSVKSSYENNEPTFTSTITELIKKYKNVYADISYIAFSKPDISNYTIVAMQDPSLCGKILFGTDFYMVDLEGRTEKSVCIDFRARLGEELWENISHRNPKNFLNLT